MPNGNETKEIGVETTPQTEKQIGMINEIQNFKEKAGELLTSEAKQRLEDKEKLSKELIEQIKPEVQKRRDEIGYNYECDDYEKRLSISEDEFHIVLENKVLTGSLKDNYQKYFEININLGKNAKNRFIKEVGIEYLVYESLDKNDYKNIEVFKIDKRELKNRLKNNRLDDLKGVKSIDLFCNNLDELDKKSLEAIFSNLKGVKSIDLNECNLGELDKESLEIIFSNLKGVESIKLRENNIGDLEKESLEIIFSNLKGVKSIDLIGFNLGELDKKSLEIIFSNLEGLKSIDLIYNDLSQEQIDYIQSLLPNTQLIFD